MSLTLQGIPAAGGVAIGACVLYDPTPLTVPQYQIMPEAIHTERERLLQAISESMQEVSSLRDEVHQRIGKEEAAIFDAHLLIMEDEALLSSAYERIEQELMNAEQALWLATDEFAQIIAGLSDSYFQARAADMYDIRMRIVSHLQGRPVTNLRQLSHPTIILAHDLLPSDTAGLDPAMVLGLVTEQGGPTSHTAILSRQMGIPAIVGVTGLFATLQTFAGVPECLAINGGTGTVEIDPNKTTLAAYEAALQDYRNQQLNLQAFRSKPAITADGVMIEVSANIGTPQQAKSAVEAGAQGVGLFRTEFLFLDRATPPDEEEQFVAYQTVLQAFAGKTVIVRTLDIGGDKSIPYMPMELENNPFLGLRGIRLCLAEKYQPLFRTQLRALLRAAESNVASLWIMLPMISDLREIRQARKLLIETEQALLSEGKIQSTQGKQLPLGVMIETPAAALLIDVLSQEAEFFSIGTNDLTQYTLAADRMNANLTDLHKPFHPAVMRSIAHIILTARNHHRWVGMCGEMAGDPRATAFLVGLGINELSMDPSSLNAVKQAVSTITTSETQELVQRVLQAESAEAIQEILTR